MRFERIDLISDSLRRHLPRSVATVLAGVAVAVGLLFAPGAHAATTAYENPFAGEQPYVGRTDMGVDLCLSAGQPILAVGDGVVIGIQRDWSEGQPYIWYQLTDGPDAGRYVYVAEQINHLARVGQTLAAGDVVARYMNKGTCIETGWATADGETLAQATTGYVEGDVTTAGISFARFLIGLGVPGEFELVVPKSQTARARHHKRRTHPVTRTPVTTSTPPATATPTTPTTQAGAAAIGVRG
jgi:hypothetical protein